MTEMIESDETYPDSDLVAFYWTVPEQGVECIEARAEALAS
jgi:hypothetical protein